MFGTFDSLMNFSNARTRVITAENVYGEPGRGGMAEVSDIPQPEVARIGQLWENNRCARELGQKWKVRPCITLAPGSVNTLMDVDGPGCIRHIWITVNGKYLRDLVLRMYWNGESVPSVEVPVGDFFCNACKHTTEVRAIPISVNPTNGMNCYFPMPFATHARITIENLAEEEVKGVYYAISFEELDAPVGDCCFHARFNRTNPLVYGDDYVILDGVEGRGNFADVISPGSRTTTAGGVRARSRCSSTGIRSSRPSAAPERRITSAAHGVSKRRSVPRSSGIRSGARTGPARVTAFTGFICSIRSASVKN